MISGRLSVLDATQPGGGTERVLVEDWCQQYPSHSVGDLEFGPDGYLYASGGDGASFNFADYGQDGNPVNPCGDPAGAADEAPTVPTAEGGALRSQDVQTAADPLSLDGTVIRIDPETGEGAPGNPMSTSSDPNARRVIANGLRNPFRIEPRPGTDELWIGDVGWSSWEEINRLTNPTDAVADNFGWPCREGNGPMGSYNNGLSMCERIADGTVPTVGPHYAYPHGSPVVSGDGCTTASGSSTSGVSFYPGGAYPDSYDGALFFADYSRQCIWVMSAGTNGVPDPTTRTLFRQSGAFAVDLATGPNGDLYYVDIVMGEVRRIRYDGADQPPVAAITADPDQGAVPLTVSFSAAASTDPEGEPLTYAWDLDGDGEFDDGTGPTASHSYTAAGGYEPAVRVTDPGGQSAVATRPVVAGSTPPQPVIEGPDASLSWQAGEDITFSGSATDADDGTLPASALSWDVILQHCATVDSCHAHTISSFDGVSSGHFDAPDHDYPAHLELRLTATDSVGVSTTASRRLDPEVSTLTVQTEPPGLSATLGGKTAAAPFTKQAIVGSRLGLSTPATQTLGGNTYEFTGWADAGARVHDVSVPAANHTYRATFEPVAGSGDQSLVAAYSFDEGSGETLSDRTGNGHDGSISGPTWTTDGKHGGALSFDGIDDLVTIADTSDLDLTTGMTLQAWIRPSTATSNWHAAIVKEIPGDLAYGLYPTGPQGPSGWIYDNDWKVAIDPDPIPGTTWTHLALTYDGTTLRLYVDGTETASTTHTGTIVTSSNPLRLGGNTIWGEHLDGRLDDVRIYNRALTPAEITTDRDTPVTNTLTP